MADTMSNPLSPINEAQLNMPSPMTARRNDKIDFAIGCDSPSKHNQSEIDWDDDTPSSPFMTEPPNSRVASNQAADLGSHDTEIDIIFEDPELPNAQPSRGPSFDFEDDKENTDMLRIQSSSKKVSSPLKSRPISKEFTASSPLKSRPTSQGSVASYEGSDRMHGSQRQATALKTQSPLKTRQTAERQNYPSSPVKSSRRGSRDDETLSMPPPPSTAKRPRMHSPKKSFEAAIETPLPQSRGPSFNKVSEQSEQQCEDLSMAQNMDDTMAAADETNLDDTCFSQFSVIPEMTLFSKLGDNNRRSPVRARDATPTEATPRPSRKRPSPDRSPSPTPRRLKTPATDQTQNSFLIDFTQQIERFSTTNPSRTPRSPTKSTTEPNLLSYINNQRSPAKARTARMSTPAKSNSLMNLLDFELPPAPTPRSVPSISVRELESMKSSYQSQISSLTATLTGREAEVESLKKAVADAERRVGESLEAARHERSKREYAENEKDEWERRGKEVEHVLNSVKEEVIRSEAEKEDLGNQAEENRRRFEDAESRILDLETQLASARAALPNEDGTGVTGYDEHEIQRLVQARIDGKIEDVSRELHAVYKKKHETKVATLKKSYEARSEKKCAELQSKLDELVRKNEELQTARDDTFSGVLPTADSRESRKIMDEQMALIDEQRAQLAGLTEEIREVRQQHARLSQELEQERVEKGELVAAVDEMLLLQTTDGAGPAIEDFRKSIQRPASSRPALPAFGAPAAPPATVSSRIGRGGASGLARPSVGKSKMMSNIERMGGMRHNE